MLPVVGGVASIYLRQGHDLLSATVGVCVALALAWVSSRLAKGAPWNALVVRGLGFYEQIDNPAASISATDARSSRKRLRGQIIRSGTHGEYTITREAVEGMLEQRQASPKPVNVEHDPTVPPVGRMARWRWRPRWSSSNMPLPWF
jgi:hypothetical protein